MAATARSISSTFSCDIARPVSRAASPNEIRRPPDPYGLGVVFDPQRARNGITLTSHVLSFRSIASESTAGPLAAAAGLLRTAPRLRAQAVIDPTSLR